jgi:hypothetical protein
MIAQTAGRAKAAGLESHHARGKMRMCPNFPQSPPQYVVVRGGMEHYT